MRVKNLFSTSHVMQFSVVHTGESVFDHSRMRSASFSSIPRERRKAWCASGALRSNSECQRHIALSSIPAARSISTHMSLSIMAGPPPAACAESIPASTRCFSLSARISSPTRASLFLRTDTVPSPSTARTARISSIVRPARVFPLKKRMPPPHGGVIQTDCAEARNPLVHRNPVFHFRAPFAFPVDMCVTAMTETRLNREPIDGSIVFFIKKIRGGYPRPCIGPA